MYRRQVVVSFRFNSTQPVLQNTTTLENNTALILGLRQSVAAASGVKLARVVFKAVRAVNHLS
jgi:hypothetical protein